MTILRHDLHIQLSTEEFTSLGLTTPVVSLAPLADVLADFLRVLAPAVQKRADRGLPRAYEGALTRQAQQSAVERRLQKVVDGENNTPE